MIDPDDLDEPSCLRYEVEKGLRVVHWWPWWPWLSVTVWDSLGLSGTVCDCLELSVTVCDFCDCLWLFMTVCVCLWLPVSVPVSVCLSEWFPFVGAYLWSFSGHFLNSNVRVKNNFHFQPGGSSLPSHFQGSTCLNIFPVHVKISLRGEPEYSWSPNSTEKYKRHSKAIC